MIALAWLVALAFLATPTGFFWCCCGPCGTYCVRVWCGFIGGPGASGVTVALQSGGVTVSSGVTDVNGDVCLDVPSAGTYTRVITGALYTTTTQSLSLTCGSNTGSAIINPIAGYSCVRSCCDDQAGPPYPDVTWPTTLYVDDGFGAVTCTSASGTAPGPWYGSASRTAANAVRCDAGGTNTFLTNASVPIHFMVTCAGGSKLRLHIGYFGCNNTGGSGCVVGGTGFVAGGAIPYLSTNPDNATCNANSSIYTGLGCGATHKGAGDGAGNTGFGDCGDTGTIHCPPTAISDGTVISGTFRFNYPSFGQIEDFMWYQLSQVYGSVASGAVNTVTISLSVTS